MTNQITLDIHERSAFAAGERFGDTGAYERLSGRVHFDVDPLALAQTGIVDLDKAPRDARRLIEILAASASAAGTARETVVMPAKSKKQQMAAGAALAAKRGERSKSSLRGASRQMVKSMSEKELHDVAKTKRKKLPTKKKS